MGIPRWLYFTLGILALVGSGQIALDAVELWDVGTDGGRVFFVSGSALCLVLGIIFIAVGVRKKD